jgi:hypothetical protein
LYYGCARGDKRKLCFRFNGGKFFFGSDNLGCELRESTAKSGGMLLSRIGIHRPTSDRLKATTAWHEPNFNATFHRSGKEKCRTWDWSIAWHTATVSGPPAAS